VLSRYYEAAKARQADVVVRVTSDCPLIDPEEVDRIIGFFLAHRDECDYLSSGLERSYPLGMDAEVFSFSALADAYVEAIDEAELEHVTPFIYRRPERYRLANYRGPEDLAHHRWTVDTPEDFELVERIISALYPARPQFTLVDIVELLKKYPDWVDINAHVQQKKLGQ
jgi:spore coat polysaccharide biosynthesis protein SpsF